MIVFLKFNDEWHRAEIVEFDTLQKRRRPICKVYLIDEGNTETVFISDIRRIPTNFIVGMAKQAIKCIFSRAQPDIMVDFSKFIWRLVEVNNAFEVTNIRFRTDKDLFQINLCHIDSGKGF